MQVKVYGQNDSGFHFYAESKENLDESKREYQFSMPGPLDVIFSHSRKHAGLGHIDGAKSTCGDTPAIPAHSCSNPHTHA